jgi:hypothetical protein
MAAHLFIIFIYEQVRLYMENSLKDMNLLQKKQYTTPEMKVEVLRPRCNLLEASLPNEIGVIINSDSGSH